MAKVYNNTIPLQQGFKYTERVVADDRTEVQSLADLTTLSVPQFFVVYVRDVLDENGLPTPFCWNGLDQTNLANWINPLALLKQRVTDVETEVVAITSGFKGTISAGTYPTKDAGYYIATNTGDYIMGSTTIAVDVSDTLTIIIVPTVINDSSKVEVPLSIVIDAVPTNGSTNAVQSNGVFDIKTALELADSNLQDDIKAEATTRVLQVEARTDAVLGKNLFNKVTANIGQSLNFSTGELTVNASYSTTDYIPIVVGQQYTSSNQMRYILYYDAYKVHIPSASGEFITTFTPPVGAVYTRFPFFVGDINVFQLEVGATSTGYENYSKTLSPSQIPSTLATTASLAITNANLATVKQQYPFEFREAVNSNMKNAVKNVILINPIPNKNYTIAVMRRNIVASSNLWDIRIYEYGVTFGDFIRWTANSYTPTTDIEQLELTGSTDFRALITVDWTQFPDGTDLTNQVYTTAGIMKSTYHYEDIETPFSDIHDIIIPPKVYLTTGRELWMYNNSIIENEVSFDKSNYNLIVEGTGVTVTTANNFNRIIGSTGTVNFKIRNLKALTKSNKTLSNIYTKTINVYSKTRATGANFNTLVIADSYFDNAYGDGMYEYLKAFALADSNTVTLKGTRTSFGTNIGEARGGWTAQNYYTNYVPVASRVGDVNVDPPTVATTNSPFMFSTDDTVLNKYFSFSEYLSTNLLTDIDNIVFFLGMNGGDGTYIDLMITNIKAALPSVNIFVCMIPTAEIWRQNMDSVTRQLDRETRNKLYLTKFQNREADNIYVVPTSACFNREFSLRVQLINTVQFPADLLTFESYSKELMVDDHHPQNYGAKSLAYLIYEYLLYVNS